jgi:hypothetical protein
LGGLSPKLYRPIRNAGMTQNIGVNKILATTKISLIFSKIQQSVSLLTGVLSKSGKGKKLSPSLSDISFSTPDLHLEAVTKILCLSRELSKLG